MGYNFPNNLKVKIIKSLQILKLKCAGFLCGSLISEGFEVKQNKSEKTNSLINTFRNVELKIRYCNFLSYIILVLTLLWVSSKRR